ncbi:MAG: Rieske (2Fe-2S) protein [Woeseiaceae bacterium]|nr:Rieske (2Fe-2S) protein [Woeseiaceae bacterium]
MSEERRIAVGPLADLEDPGCREFTIGEGDWPFRGFVVRKGDEVFAYQNFCMHVGHPLNWMPDAFLTKDRRAILCASHGAVYEIETGLCVGGPCVGKTLRPVEAEVEDGMVYVTGPVSLR